jgi:hypothetical protein
METKPFLEKTVYVIGILLVVSVFAFYIYGLGLAIYQSVFNSNWRN